MHKRGSMTENATDGAVGQGEMKRPVKLAETGGAGGLK